MENVGIAEQADQQRMVNSQQEGLVNEQMTPSGMTPDDTDPDLGMAGGPTGNIQQ
jgi:hypothetical protein